MMRPFISCILLLLIFLSSFSTPAFSLSSIHVDSEDETYHLLEVLTAHGLTPSIILAQRPFSREEVARLVLEARKNLKSAARPWVQEVLAHLEKKYAEEIDALESQKRGLQVHAFERAFLELALTNADRRAFVPSNGGGAFTATAFPFFDNREGRHYLRGEQESLETEHWANLGRFASVFLRPRLAVLSSSKAPFDSTQATIQQGYAAFNFHNVELKIGRSSLLYGQSEHGGLLLSDNARPLDHFQISNDHPFKLPFFFKYLGYNKISFFVADLGPEASFPHTLLAGYKWTIKPVKWWEMGLSNVMEFGGTGGPGMSIAHFFADLSGFGNSGGMDAANKILGFDSRIHLGFLRGTEVYGEWLIDDKTVSSIARTLTQTSAYLGGIFIPRVNASGTVQARVELRYLGAIIYRHFQFLSGHTLNDRILGDALGPDGRSIKASLGWDVNARTRLQTDLAYEFADSNTYDINGVASAVLVNGPAEKRMRAVFTARREFNPVITLAAIGGYEHVQNFAYGPGDNRHEVMMNLKMTVNWGERFRFGK